MADDDLAKQLAMNVHTWNRLRQYGVTERTGLRLDFAYKAPTRAAADALVALLKAETDYDIAELQTAGSFFSRTFTVSGATQETNVSLATLDQWVDWMVAAGRQCGCRFDGWGAQVPAEAH